MPAVNIKHIMPLGRKKESEVHRPHILWLEEEGRGEESCAVGVAMEGLCEPEKARGEHCVLLSGCSGLWGPSHGGQNTV